MAYIYQVAFDTRPDQMNQLEIGSSLERVLGYLRALLPGQPGHVTTRAMYSIDIPDKTHVICQSMWEAWEDIDAHRQSTLAENKVLAEFEPHVELDDLCVRIFEEVS